MCPSSLCSQPFPILNRLSSWRGERQGAHCTRFSHTKKGHFVEHGVRVWLGRGVGAGALTWAGRAQDPLLCICFPCSSNSPQLHLPFVSLAVVKHFFSLCKLITAAIQTHCTHHSYQGSSHLSSAWPSTSSPAQPAHVPLLTSKTCRALPPHTCLP